MYGKEKSNRHRNIDFRRQRSNICLRSNHKGKIGESVIDGKLIPVNHVNMNYIIDYTNPNSDNRTIHKKT